MDEYKKALYRERKARKEAERILEAKSIELYSANQKLKKLYSSLETKHHSILEEANDIIFQLDAHGKCEFINSSVQDILGYRPQELINTSMVDLLVEESAKKFKKAFLTNDANCEGSSYMELKVQTKDQGSKWIGQNIKTLIEDNKIIGYIGVARDISSQKAIQAELRKAKKEAERSMRAKEAFLASMSHEIRTPLNAVIGMTYLLDKTDTDPKQKEFLQSIKYSSEILMSLLNDILDLSKIEAGKVEINEEPFDMIQLLRSQQKSVAYRLQKKGIYVQLSYDHKIPKNIIGDKIIVNQLVMNLLSNALKFTKNGYIKIDTQIVAEDEESILIDLKVIDSGMGMKKEELAIIFDSFQQLGNRKLQQKGSGLGLSIVKRLTEALGGKISVESQYGKGTSFNLRIPFIKKIESTINNHTIEESMTTNKTQDLDILVAEDDHMNSVFLWNVLEGLKVNSVFVKDGEQAVEQCMSNKFDVILMDIQMPRRNGYEASKIIRSTENPNKGTPIFALSDSSLIDEKRKALEVGMNDHLAKPYSPAQLEKIILKVLKQKEDLLKVDKAILEELYQNDLSFKASMFKSFISELDDIMDTLNSAMNNDDMQDVKKKCHQLRPSFKMVGLGNISIELEKIEALKDVEISEAKERLNDIIQLRPEIEHLIEDEKPSM